MSFSDPYAPESDTVIWRYMDDRKFEDLLGRFSEHADWKPEQQGTVTKYVQGAGHLWFGYPSSFGDPLEGTHTAVSQNPHEYVTRVIESLKLDDATAARFRDHYLSSDNQKLRDGMVFMAQLCGVSSWSTSQDDQDLWDRFGGYPNGVAVSSTCGRVLESLAFADHAQRKSAPAACAVGYIDHSKYFLPEDGFRGILALLRAGLRDECEIRLVVKSAALAAIPMQIRRSLSDVSSLDELFRSPTPEEIDAELSRIVDEARAALDAREKSGANGFHLPLKLEGLMTEVIIGPDSEDGYEQAVRDRFAQAGLEKVPVRKSAL